MSEQVHLFENERIALADKITQKRREWYEWEKRWSELLHPEPKPYKATDEDIPF